VNYAEQRIAVPNCLLIRRSLTTQILCSRIGLIFEFYLVIFLPSHSNNTTILVFQPLLRPQAVHLCLHLPLLPASLTTSRLQTPTTRRGTSCFLTSTRARTSPRDSKRSRPTCRRTRTRDSGERRQSRPAQKRLRQSQRPRRYGLWRARLKIVVLDRKWFKKIVFE
jgi:hypothetical protein